MCVIFMAGVGHLVGFAASGDILNNKKTGQIPAMNISEQNDMAKASEIMDQMLIMQKCNESFRTEPGGYCSRCFTSTGVQCLLISSAEYLVELNSTGTFPDESDKTPMVSLSSILAC